MRRTDVANGDQASPGVASIASAPTKTLAHSLDRVFDELERRLTDSSPLITRFKVLRERLRNSRLQLAVVGQFKRGKSTFINALLGAPVLPVAVVPLTAVPIFIAWGTSPLACVHFGEGRGEDRLATSDPDEIRLFLFRFVAEEANPGNHMGVSRVQLFFPAAILAGGTVLIDTPGVGSTLRHNTESAWRVLPECDAALFIVSADPPITEAEVEYLRLIRSKTSQVFFVLNKADYFAPEERASAITFLCRVLEDNDTWLRDTPIFCVSSRNGLAAKQSGDPKMLEASGIAAVEAYLVACLAEEKARLLDSAIRGKAAGILTEAISELALRLQTLKLPVDELSSKSRSFENALSSIEEQRRAIGDLLAGDQRRLRDDLERRICELRNDASARLSASIDEKIATASSGEQEIRRAMSGAVEEIFEAAGPRLVSEFSAKADAVLSTHQGRIDPLVDAVRRTASDVFEVPFRNEFEHDPFQLREEPYWITEEVRLTLIPDMANLVDRFLPARLAAARLRKRAMRRVVEIVLRNAENLRWAILRGIDETFRKASDQFDDQLDEVIGGTRHIIADSLARRHERQAETESEVTRLAEAVAALCAERNEFAGHSAP